MYRIAGLVGVNVLSLFFNLKVILGIVPPSELVPASPDPSSETINSTVNSPPEAGSVAGERVMNSVLGGVVSAVSAVARTGAPNSAAATVAVINNFRI